MRAVLYDCPATLTGGHDLCDWITMFCGAFLKTLADIERTELVSEVEDRPRPDLSEGEDWEADYRRLCIAVQAVKK